MKKVFFPYIAVALAAFSLTANSSAAIPEGYYNSLEGKSGVNLKKAAKSIARNHTVIAYGDGTWDAFESTDTHMVGGQLCWWDMYSNNNVRVSSGHPGLNIEHSVANSWWGGAKNDAYKDLFHLNPSDSEANNRKSNYPLGIVLTETWGNGVTHVGHPKSGTCGGANYVYEPDDRYKGDFARVYFYMFTIYDDIAWMNASDRNYMYDVSSDLLLKPWAYEMLLEWAANDPVDQKERDRNEAIYKIQHNRNPFIDCPQLAEHIWGSKKNQAFHFDGTVDPDPVDPDPVEPDPGPVDPDPTPVGQGFWYPVTSTSDLNEDSKYVLVTPGDLIGMSTDASSNSEYLTPCARKATLDSSVSPGRLSAVPDDIAVIQLEQSGTGWILHISDVNGTSLGYLKCSGDKKISIAGSFGSGDNIVANIKPGNNYTEITYTYSGSTGYLQYNTSSPRFTTYKSNSQQNPMMYRFKETTSGVEAIDTALDGSSDPVLIGIYDINGRLMNAKTVDSLEPGIYVIVTNYGTRKILK